MSTQYTYTVKDAQEFDGQRTTLWNTIAMLRTQYESADRNQKRKLAQQIKKYEGELESLREKINQAPPAPVSPEDAWQVIEKWLQVIIGKATDTRAVFIERLNSWGVQSAAGSYLEEAVITEVQADYAKKIMDALIKIDDLDQRVTEYEAWITRLAEYLTKEVIDNAIYGTHRSTSAMANITDEWSQRAKAKLLNDISGRYGYHRIESALEGVKSWRQLQAEQTTE